MDHVIASAPEDSAEAEGLAERLRTSGLPGQFVCIAIEDEVALAETLEEDRDGASAYVLLLSRAFAGRIRSLVVLDKLLGVLLLGRRRVLASCLPGEEETPRDLAMVVQRHDGITDESTLDGLARRVAGRLGRIHVNSPAPFHARRSAKETPRLRYLLLAIIALLLGMLAWMSIKGAMRR
jgi:hypothetical protein